jgi:hypothetical protein
MNIKIICHIMPWEIDHALLVVDKLKKSIYHIDSQDKIYIDTALNLSSKITNWEKSSLPVGDLIRIGGGDQVHVSSRVTAHNEADIALHSLL